MVIWLVQEKEVWSRETITSLRQEIDNLNALVEKGADLAVQFQSQEPCGQVTLRHCKERDSGTKRASHFTAMYRKGPKNQAGKLLYSNERDPKTRRVSYFTGL